MGLPNVERCKKGKADVRYLSLRRLVLSSIVASVILPAAVSVASPSAPSPLSPAAYVTDASPEFTWSLVDGASSYEFTLMDDSDSVVYFNQAGIVNPPFAIVGAVFDQSKVYHWKVRAVDAAGAVSSWSDIESFLVYDPELVPNVVSPTGYINTTTPLFQWGEVARAVNYDLWILNESETVTINFFGSLEGTSFQEPSSMPFSPYTVYHYRVRSRLPNGTTSIWSDPQSFMFYQAGDTPRLLGPTVQAPIGMTNFSWIPVESASKYEFVLMNESETSTLIYDRDVPVNGYAPKADVPLELGVVYHWKVRTVLASGATSLWSDTFSFAFFDPKNVPDALLPFGYITSGRPLLEWSQVNGAASYRIQVIDSVTKQLLLNDSVTGDTRYDLAAHLKLQADVSYDWRVKAVMADGTASVWSQPLSFRITKEVWSGLIPTLRMSVHYYPSQIVKFNWQTLNLDGISGIRYHVVLRVQPTDGPFATVWSGDASQSAPNTLTLPSDVYLRPKTQHAWFVQAYDTNGVLIGESRKYQFNTPAEVPASYGAAVAALQSKQQAEVAALIAANQQAIDSLKKAQDDRRNALAQQQAAQADALKLKLANQLASLQASQEAAVSNLQKSQELAKANLQKNQATAVVNLKKTQAAAVASLDKAQAAALASLQKSQATALTAFKKQKGVTQDQINQFIADQQTAVSDLIDSQQAQKRELVASHQSALENLINNQTAETNALQASQVEAMKNLMTAQWNAITNQQVSAESQSKALKAAQTLQTDKLNKNLQAQMDALLKRQARKLASLSVTHLAQVNRLLRAQEAELLRTR